MGCTGTGTLTTMITTVTPRPEPCSQTCAECMEDDLVRRVNPSPENQSKSPTDFIRTQAKQAQLVPHAPPGRETTSGLTAELGPSPLKMGVADFYGCTSVIVLSTKRIWLSHIWQVPSIEAFVNNREFFKTDVLDKISYGCRFMDQDFPGIASFTEDGGHFSQDYSPKAIIVVPQNAPSEAYPDVIPVIQDRLTELLPAGTPIHVQRYINMNMSDTAMVGAYGKVLVFYDPDQETKWDVNEDECGLPTQMAQIDVYADNWPQAILTLPWETRYEQMSGDDAKVKREVSASACQKPSSRPPVLTISASSPDLSSASKPPSSSPKSADPITGSASQASTMITSMLSVSPCYDVSISDCTWIWNLLTACPSTTSPRPSLPDSCTASPSFSLIPSSTTLSLCLLQLHPLPQSVRC
ncbi:hypothetical protein K402DRAFT_71390 [Aulographum hederae CBS 113979]|uniref:Uncharacterized protein n=1 Tax=Aulographum hederae CBS 113979 TaxID=1176131 RepID=A0A6G1HF34_9PEZI|nr:hypothetical protein K402DRAFT_71390 [Aulographum hederae CBS 113979]